MGCSHYSHSGAPEVAESVGMEELAAVCHAADSYGAYDTRSGSPWLSMSVTCKWHRLMLCSSRPLLARYLPMLGPDVTAVPNTMQPYDLTAVYIAHATGAAT